MKGLIPIIVMMVSFLCVAMAAAGDATCPCPYPCQQAMGMASDMQGLVSVLNATAEQRRAAKGSVWYESNAKQATLALLTTVSMKVKATPVPPKAEVRTVLLCYRQPVRRVLRALLR